MGRPRKNAATEVATTEEALALFADTPPTPTTEATQTPQTLPPAVSANEQGLPMVAATFEPLAPQTAQSDGKAQNASNAQAKGEHVESDAALKVVTGGNRSFRRNELGLIDGVEYKYKEDGRIDWEAMFDPEYYVYPENDRSRTPLLKVDGVRNLADVRGIEWKRVEFQQTTPEMVICKVAVRYIPNFENPNGLEWAAIADASAANIGTTFVKYLAAIAETRAVGRCHREALGIRLCTAEEVDPSELKNPEDNGPVKDVTMAAIRRQMQLKQITDTDLLIKIQEKLPKVSSLAELTQSQAATLLTWLNAKPNAKTQNKE